MAYTAEQQFIIDEANKRAAKSGKDPRYELIMFATSIGYTPDMVDQFMGWPKNSTQTWGEANGILPAVNGANSVDTTNKTTDTSYVGTKPDTTGTTVGTATNTTPDSTTSNLINDQVKKVVDQVNKTVVKPTPTSGTTLTTGSTSLDTGVGKTNTDASTTNFTATDFSKWSSPTSSMTATDLGSWGTPGSTTSATNFGSWDTGPTTAAKTSAITPTTSSAAPKFNLGTMAQSTDWNVDPKTQTVAGQLQSVISNDSPLMQQARSRALQSMNARGLVNSSMATGAADAAMYDKALQIATPDAATFADAAKTNAASKNQFNLQNNNFVGQGSLAEYNTAAQDWSAGRNFDRTLQRDQNQQDYNLQNKSADQRNNLQTIQANQTNALQRDDLAQKNNLQTLQAQQANNLQTLGAQQANNLQTLQANQSNDLQKLQVQRAAANDVAAIEAQYKSLTQASASATSILNTMQASLDKLDANPDIQDQATYDALRNAIKVNAAQSLKLIGALATDVDMSAYINSLFEGTA